MGWGGDLKLLSAIVVINTLRVKTVLCLYCRQYSP